MTVYHAVPPLPLYKPFDPDLEPADYLGSVLAYTAEQGGQHDPDYLREVALHERVTTYDEPEQLARYESSRSYLIDGRSMAAATPTDVLCDALATFGYARDRAANGDWSLDVEAWLEAARVVVVDRKLDFLAARLDAGTWPIGNPDVLREFIRRAQEGDAAALDAVIYYLENPVVMDELRPAAPAQVAA